MNRTSLRRIAAPSAAALALGLAVSACGAGNETSTPAAVDSDLPASSTAPAPAPRSPPWTPGAPASRRRTPASPSTTTRPAPAPASRSSTPAASTSPAPTPRSTPRRARWTRPRSAAAATPSRSPTTSSPIAVVFNLDGVDELQLSPATIAGIFDGKIKTWDDAAIKADNPDAKLPSTKIDPVHRSDESGTTKNFTDYLEKASDGAWTYPADKVWPIKSGEGANQTSGMISAVKGGKGTIGYADLSQVGDLKAAAIKVGDA